MIDLGRAGRVLALFAHPDDETLAAGATMAKLGRMGAEVSVAIAATGIHSRRNLVADEDERSRQVESLRGDCERAMGVLGIPPERLTLGEFADNEMDADTLLTVIHWVEELVERTRPDTILTHHRYCTNIDHQRLHEAAVVATRPDVGRHVALVCGEVPSSTGYLRPARWEPNLYVEVEQADVSAKIEAMESYAGEARPDPHPRSPEVLQALAKVRGSESGFMLAEAFMVQRSFG